MPPLAATLKLAVALLATLTASMVVSGYQALLPLLRKHGAYVWLCHDPPPGPVYPEDRAVCNEQQLRLDLCFTLAMACANGFSIVAMAIERYSNAGVCFAMGELMLTAGAIILGSSSADFQGYLVGFILLGIGGSWTSFSVLFLSELLPHRRSLTLSLLIAATDASGGVPYILLLISQSVPAADLSFLMLAYAGVPFCAALAATWLFGLTRTRTGANVPQHSTFHSSRSSLLMARVSHLGTLRTTTSNYDLPTAAIEESISTSSVFSPAPLSGETHSDDGMGDGAGKGASERGDNDDDDFVSCRETLDSTSMKSEAEKRSVTGAAGAERRMAVTDAMPPFAPSTSISAGAQSRATNAHRLSHSSQTSQPNQDRPGSSLTRVRSFQSRRSHPQGVANSRLSTITEAPSGSFGQHLSQPSTITRDKTPLVTVGARHSGMSGTQRLLLSPRPDVDAGGADGVVEVCWIPVRTVRQAVSNVGFLLATVFICTVGTAKYFFMENFQQIVEFDTGDADRAGTAGRLFSVLLPAGALLGLGSHWVLKGHASNVVWLVGLVTAVCGAGLALPVPHLFTVAGIALVALRFLLFLAAPFIFQHLYGMVLGNDAYGVALFIAAITNCSVYLWTAISRHIHNFVPVIGGLTLVAFVSAMVMVAYIDRLERKLKAALGSSRRMSDRSADADDRTPLLSGAVARRQS